MRILFLAVLALAIPMVHSAYALWPFPDEAVPYDGMEHGINYDQKLIGTTADGRQIYTWQSTPFSAQRIQDGNGDWQNYIVRDDDKNIYFEAAQGSVSFNKSACTISVYDGGRIHAAPKYVLSHTIKEAIDGTDNWQASPENSFTCTYEITKDTYQAHIIAKKGDFTIQYDLDFNLGFEWTYKYFNNNIFSNNKKYGFTFVCDGAQCDDIRINGIQPAAGMMTKEQLENATITVGGADFDPKDYSHDALWALKKQNDKMIVDFTDAKGAIKYGETIVVDPTFGYTAAQSQQYVTTPAVTQCETTTGNSNGSSAVTARVSIASTGAADNCVIQVGKWIITSIPDAATINSANFRHDRGAAGGSTNEIKLVGRNMTSDPQTTNSATKYLQGTQGNFVISPWTESAAGTNDIVRSFNSNGTTSIQNQLPYNWYGLALAFVSMRSDTVAHNIDNLVNWELNVTYTVPPPNPPTGFTCTSVGRHVNCSWTAPAPLSGTQNGVTALYIGRSLDNSTWPVANKTSTGNVTSFSLTDYWAINKLYYTNVTAVRTGSANSTAAFTSFTTDSLPSAPQNPYTTPISDSRIKINWSPPSSTGNDVISGYRIQYCITCTSWTLLVNNTNTYNYNQTGLSSGQIVKYRMSAWNGVGYSPFTANFTGQTYTPTTGSITQNTGIVGDTTQINATVSITNASPSPVTVSQLKLYRNGTLLETKATSVSIASGASSSNFDPFWNRITAPGVFSYKIHATVSNSTGTVDLASSNFTASREYSPSYFNAVDNPATEGQVNYTLSRFSAEDGIHLKVNRVGGTLSSTWTINCITQTNAEARATVNQSVNWPGTWNNRSGTGYFNGTWNGFKNTQGYVTCFNPPGMLFTTTSYTNSSLALFGIEIFDLSYGSMLGVPVGIFFLALAGGMANKRTAPTWIVVLLGMAGVMATIGFFTFTPIIWGLALVTGLLGLLVNQKVF